MTDVAQKLSRRDMLKTSGAVTLGAAIVTNRRHRPAPVA